jgi:hypothetical protein
MMGPTFSRVRIRGADEHVGSYSETIDSCTYTSRVRKGQPLPEDRPDIGMQICLVGVERYLFGCLDSSSCRHQRRGFAGLPRLQKKEFRSPAVVLDGLDSNCSSPRGFEPQEPHGLRMYSNICCL